jgi:hypothetical protein
MAVSTVYTPIHRARTNCAASGWPRALGMAFLAAAVAMLEAWLRFPVRPVLDNFMNALRSSSAWSAFDLRELPSA